MASQWQIRSGRLIDPRDGTERVGDLWIQGGTIVERPDPVPENVSTLDAHGHLVVPGFHDLHVHFREPGNESAETVASGAAAAARGGFTTVVMMPNTSPPIDTADRVSRMLRLGRAAGHVHVLTSACLTLGRAGAQTADLAALAAAGAVAFTDDGNHVTDTEVMRRAMAQAHELGLPVLDHALDPAIAKDGVMRAGPRARQLRLPGVPAEAETAAVRRNIELCRETGCATHIQHVSTGAAIALIRRAREQGLPISGELTPHHLALTDEDIPGDDANFKMSPPLGSRRDRELLTEALAEGVLQALATDHAPHCAQEKARGFLAAPFGVTGLETAVALSHERLVRPGHMRLVEWVRRWTSGPAEILGQPTPGLSPGDPADVAILDMESEWTVDPAAFLSKSSNSPFVGRRLRGRAVCTLCEGRLTWRADTAS